MEAETVERCFASGVYITSTKKPPRMYEDRQCKALHAICLYHEVDVYIIQKEANTNIHA